MASKIASRTQVAIRPRSVAIWPVGAGRHPCTLCRFTGGPATLPYRSLNLVLGSANLYVPASDCIYLAQSLIVHYVDAHGYLPPAEFQLAVLACPQMRSMSDLE